MCRRGISRDEMDRVRTVRILDEAMEVPVAYINLRRFRCDLV